MGDGYEQLAELKQEGLVIEYRDKFKLLSAPLIDIPEEVLMSQFKVWLWEDVKANVKLLKPKNLKELMNCAIEVEARNMVKVKVEEERRTRSIKSLGGSKWSGIKPPLICYISPIESPKSIWSKVTGKTTDSKGTETHWSYPNKVSIPITTSNNSSSSSNREHNASLKLR